MTIAELIKKAFPEGLEYDDAAQLCLALYSVRALPDELMPQCTKENLPVVFAEVVSAGTVRVGKVTTAASYGANFHDPKDKGHWVEVIAASFKIHDLRIDWKRGEALAARLRAQCRSEEQMTTANTASHGTLASSRP